MSTVVETVRAERMADLVARRDQSKAAMVELRLDGVRNLDVGAALAGRRVPAIVTCRASWEGGSFDGSEAERLGILEHAMRLGAEFVDVEWQADRSRFTSRGATKLVISHHDFQGMPADLEARVAAMRAEDADVVKVAVTPSRLSECLTLRRVMSGSRPHVAIAMGMRGQVTRLCPWLFGSAWTYGGTAAPGQVSVDEMVSLYRVPNATASTKVYAITGSPLVHSASPAMHNTALAALGMDAMYVALESDDAAEFLAAAAALGVTSASVTAPLKPALRQQVADANLDEVSRAIGALNTLRRAGDGWEGRNFDADGFLGPLKRRGVRLAGCRAVVLGAGGTARMAAWTLAREGAHVAIAARRREPAAAVAAEFGVTTSPWPPATGWDLLVNTTPAGTWPGVDRAPIEQDHVRGGLVYDLIYNPRETTLMKWARENGADAIGGLEMLVTQACHQFRWWTGRDAPASAMERAADEFVMSSRTQRP